MLHPGESPHANLPMESRTREIYIKNRLVHLWQEVNAVARDSIQREVVDPLPFLSRMPGSTPTPYSSMQGLMPSSAPGAPSGELSGALSSSLLSSPAMQGSMPGYGPVQPRVQEARAARRQSVAPMPDCSRRRPGDTSRKPCDGVDVMAVGTTPPTLSLLIEVPSADEQHVEPCSRTQRGEASNAKNDHLSHDEAASLLMALPMSRGPSDLGPSPCPTPRVAAVPMQKNLSTLSVSGCLSLLDDPDEPTDGSLSSPRMTSPLQHAPPRLSAVPMSKQCSIISISGFLAD